MMVENIKERLYKSRKAVAPGLGGIGMVAVLAFGAAQPAEQSRQLVPLGEKSSIESETGWTISYSPRARASFRVTSSTNHSGEGPLPLRTEESPLIAESRNPNFKFMTPQQQSELRTKDFKVPLAGMILSEIGTGQAVVNIQPKPGRPRESWLLADEDKVLVLRKGNELRFLSISAEPNTSGKTSINLTYLQP